MAKISVVFAAVLSTSIVHLLAGPPTASTPQPAAFEEWPFEAGPQFQPGLTILPFSTPESVTQVRNLEDLSGRVPNLFISDTSLRGFRNGFSLRGLASVGTFTDPFVPVFVDDIPLGEGFANFQPLYDLDRIEVFRGPQPTSFGQTAPGGAISLRTRRADPRAWHGGAATSWSNYDGQEHRVWAGGPLIPDKLTLDLSGFWSLNTGYIDNALLKNRRDDRDALGGRAVLRWTPAADWEIEAGFEGARAQDGSKREVRIDEDVFRRFRDQDLGQSAGDPYRVRSDEAGSLNLRQHREWLSLTKRFDTWQVRSITSHRSWEVDPVVQDLDHSPQNADLNLTLPGFLPLDTNDGEVLSTRRESEVWSQELRFESLPPELATSKDDSKKVVLPANPDGSFWWKAGLFFQRRELDGSDIRTRNENFAQTVITENYLFIRGRDFFDRRPIILRILDFDDTTRYFPVRDWSSFSLDEETEAAYAQAGYRFGRLELEGGLRLEHIRKTFSDSLNFTNVSTRFLNLNTPGIVPGPQAALEIAHDRRQAHSEYNSWGLSPTLGATFHLNDQAQLFARSTYAFRPGGVDGGGRFTRENVWANELGARVSMLGGRVYSQLTGYYYHLDVGPSEGASLGLEWEVAWQIARGLVFSGNVGYNQTKLERFRLDYAPNFTALAALDYAHDCGFSAHFECVAIGDVNYGGQELRQDAHGLLNARVGYERGRYGAYLFAHNLTGKKHYTEKDFSTFERVGVIGEPRIWGLMATVRF